MSTPEKNVEALGTAMKGSDKAAIVKIIANTTSEQRQKIKLAYKTAFGRVLISEIKDKLDGLFSSDFRNTVSALFEPPVDYDVHQLHNAMNRICTDKDTLIEILATRPNWVLEQVKARYAELYKKDLEKAIGFVFAVQQKRKHKSK